MRREDATSSDAEALRDARSPGAEEDPSAPRLSEHAASPRPAFESSREQAAADAARRAAGQAVDVDLTPFGFKGMRLRTLVTLRWFAVGGQTAAVIDRRAPQCFIVARIVRFALYAPLVFSGVENVRIRIDSGNGARATLMVIAQATLMTPQLLLQPGHRLVAGRINLRALARRLRREAAAETDRAIADEPVGVL